MRKHTRIRRLHESDKSVYDAVEEICNDSKLFREAFDDYKTGLRDIMPECMIECGEDLGSYIEDTAWSLDKVLPMILKSLKKAGKYNKPLQNGDINCYFLFDNDDYDATFETYDTEKDWIEAIRQMCLEKEIWTYERDIDSEIDEDAILRIVE